MAITGLKRGKNGTTSINKKLPTTGTPTDGGTYGEAGDMLIDATNIYICVTAATAPDGTGSVWRKIAHTALV